MENVTINTTRMPIFNDTDHINLLSVFAADITLTIIACTLSFLGSAFIFCAYCVVDSLRPENETRRLLLYLTVSDLFVAIGNFIGTIRFIGIYDSKPLYANFGEEFASDNVCIVQSFISATGSMWSFCWNTAIAIHLWVALVYCRNGTWSWKVKIFCHSVCWLLPLAVAIAAAKCEVLGEDFDQVTGTWCWIKSSLSRSDRITWMIISGKGWELVSYLVTCFMFFYLKGYMWRQKKRFNQRRFNDVSLRLRAEDENYLYLWLIGYLLRIWGTVRFFLFVSESSSNDKPFADINFALVHLESFGDSSKAFFTFILFCIADKTTRQLLWNKICRRRRGYEEILQSINAEPNNDNGAFII
ncbi:G-protein coupled receptor 157-like isoform X3 [Mytilus californianus]|uniref:G-protein coupled receptor 157-like isoform X3 n=1 Tax=Mytilus californianus TaxID=6549 RepID=UPI0022450F9A|nr:G-protein coupled receptor 157-like isoform X3 [Mytilus californianus]